MKTQEFFDAVYKGEMFDSDIYKHIEDITDGFNSEKLQRLCDDFDLYLVKKFNEDNESAISLLVKKKAGEISEEEYNKRVEKRNKPILFIDDFFSDRTQSSIEKRKRLLNYNNFFDDIDVNEINLTRLRNIFIDLKKEHIIKSTEYDFDEINEIFTTPKGEPKFACLNYWESKQTESSYSKSEFINKLLQSYRLYDEQLKFKEKHLPFDSHIPLENGDNLFNEKPGIYLSRKELSQLLKHLNSLYQKWFPNNPKFISKSNFYRNKNSINWLKADDTLEQFIEALKEHNLIEAKETEAIIKDHFKPAKEQNKKPEPINWLETNSLLAYMIESLDQQYIKPTNLWSDTVSHFSVNGQTPQNMKQTANRYKQNKSGKPKNYQIIDSIIQSLSD